jgi:hypothetical protein
VARETLFLTQSKERRKMIKKLSIYMLALGWLLVLVSPAMAQQNLIETVTNVSIPAYR